MWDKKSELTKVEHNTLATSFKEFSTHYLEE